MITDRTGRRSINNVDGKFDMSKDNRSTETRPLVSPRSTSLRAVKLLPSESGFVMRARRSFGLLVCLVLGVGGVVLAGPPLALSENGVGNAAAIRSGVTPPDPALGPLGNSNASYAISQASYDGSSSFYGSLGPTSSWLDVINLYRTASWLNGVSNEPTWTDGIAKHLVYMASTPASFFTGTYANVHYENPLSPYYTPEGDAAGQSSDLGGGTSDRIAMEGWVQAPLHMIGMLRPGLTRSAFARNPSTTRAGLDVIRGLVYSPPSPYPVVFPGDGMTTSVNRFYGEFPNPLESCGYSAPAGLPLIALLPFAPPAGTKAVMQTPSGSFLSSSADICTITSTTYTTTDLVYGPVGRSILESDRAVLIIPRQPLAMGTYKPTITLPGYGTLTWSFDVGPETKLEPRRVKPGTPLVVTTGSPAKAVVGTVTVVNPLGDGFVTVYPCNEIKPNSSNLNFVSGQTIANTFVARADSNGQICVYSSATVHLIFDRVGELLPDGLHAAVRDLDTRQGQPIVAGSSVVVRTGNPGKAIVGNVTIVQPSGSGFVTIYPCAGGRTETSNVNFGVGQTVAGAFVSLADSAGDICVYSSVSTHILVDRVAEWSPVGIHSAVRDADTRRTGVRFGPGLVVDIQTNAPGKAILGTVTVTQPISAGFVTVYGCSNGKPPTSNLNFVAGQTTANAFFALADPQGHLCFASSVDTHLIVDRVAERDPVGLHIAIRDADTRQPPTTFNGPVIRP
jgi:hypothetical protein